MTPESALEQLGVAPGLLSDEECRALDDDGYVVLDAVLDADELEQVRRALTAVAVERRRLSESGDGLRRLCGMRLGVTERRLAYHEQAFGEGECSPAAERFLHRDAMLTLLDAGKTDGDIWDDAFLLDLLGGDPAFDLPLTSPKVLTAAVRVLGPKIHSMGTLCRAPRVGDGHQVLHRDGDPVCTTLWLIDDMTGENGPTRIVPGTHRNTNEPADELGGDAERAHPREIRLAGKAGQVVVFDGRLWHGGTVRAGGGPRRVLIIQFMPRTHVRDHPVHVPPDAVARYTPAQRWLLHLDDELLSENERAYALTGRLAEGYE
jgi:hypothetical protein